MNHFIRNNFLAICVTLAVVYAFANGATIYQQAPKKPDVNLLSMPTASDKVFADYWYKNKAEINSYALQKDNNGQSSVGESIMIFVTENFRTDKQVKLDADNKSEATSVLKVNLTEKFLTGIADYSLMTSVFSAIDTKAFPHALKVATSLQDWNGMAYLQLNNKNRAYQIEGKSYTEKEVQEDFELKRTWLEDEIWNNIRLSPETLPNGDIEMIPSFSYSQLTHQLPTVLSAKAALKDYTGTDFTEKKLKVFSITYPEKSRSVEVVFQEAFPYKIMGWTEHNVNQGKTWTTKAILKKTLLSDYWTKHSPKDVALRDSLSLH
ncbi:MULTISPECIES: hypothetical protein [unclassified Arcicella]|uniref:hypothetical protein n=1 Tax=unclassified Arcicella TaxID=2644986 RepID=UPI002858B4BB|nr:MULTISPECIES: hypothetical protein [unclassified Arcicella]MDR6560411.1 hypothetical protein [Arcicella sp. BE51]MDR6809983.1 hypothetical protein [Arcicella sp. BE140]MDR6821332.1 hypothetical protein [Arcicella sp. BE139]